MGKRLDLAGKTINGIYVESYAYTDEKRRNVHWNCICHCGNRFIALSTSIANGHVKSCGCLKYSGIRNATLTHGCAKRGKMERLYGIWKGIKRRCSRSDIPASPYYYNKGIRMCSEWEDYPVFREWAMTHGYADDLTIERIDVNGNYCPENCKWITRREQHYNRSDTRWITYKGETKPLVVWCNELGLKYSKVSDRINASKWSVERAFETP